MKISQIILVTIFTIAAGCNSTVTKEDVQDDIADAQKATEEAAEETAEAIDTQKEYVEQQKSKMLDSLNARAEQIKAKMAELRNTANNSPNATVRANMSSSIDALESEQNQVLVSIEEVKNVEIDWEEAAETISKSIDKIDQELKKLEKSIQD